MQMSQFRSISRIQKVTAFEKTSFADPSLLMIDSQNEFLLSNPIRLSDPSALELKAGVSEILKWHSHSLSLCTEL